MSGGEPGGRTLFIHRHVDQSIICAKRPQGGRRYTVINPVHASDLRGKGAFRGILRLVLRSSVPTSPLQNLALWESRRAI